MELKTDPGSRAAGGETESKSYIRLRPMLLAACLCAVLTIPVAWNAGQWISTDGLSYLEVAVDTVQLGLGPLLSNAYWSPAYPALLALTMKLTHPSLAHELVVIHSLDWLICVAMYFCFTYFLFGLLRWSQLEHGGILGSPTGFFSFMAFAYTLLFISNLEQSLWMVGPNLLMECLVYLVAGICIRLGQPDSRYLRHIVLGVVLGLAYAVKVALLPLGIILLAILFVLPVARTGRKGAVIAAASLLLTALPLIAHLSYVKGRFTFGDAGNLDYAFYVNGLPRSMLWQSHLPDGVTLVHPAKTISTDPAILKFEGPFPSALPYWYDPSWWYDGVKGHFILRRQIQQYLRTFHLAPKIMLSDMNVFEIAERWLPMWAGLAAFVVLGLRFRNVYRFTGRHVWLFLWPVLAFLMFETVLLDYRYLFPFFVMGWITLFLAAWAVTKSEISIGVTLTVAAGLLLAYGPGFARDLEQTIRSPATSDNLAVAGRLAALGIRPGDQVASMGWPDACYFMRLAGARFTIQMVTNDPSAVPKLAELHELPQPQVQAVIETLRANGARALVSMGQPGFANDSGWVKLPKGVYVRPIQ
jgi:hypothetical protein